MMNVCATAGPPPPRRPRRFAAPESRRLALRIAAVAFSWLVYGLVRTDHANFGFSLRGTTKGIEVVGALLGGACVFCMLVSLGVAPGTRGARPLTGGPWGLRWLRRLRTLAICAVLGCGSSELWMLSDEAFFMAQSRNTPATTIYVRPRLWPHGHAELGFAPPEHYWAPY